MLISSTPLKLKRTFFPLTSPVHFLQKLYVGNLIITEEFPRLKISKYRTSISISEPIERFPPKFDKYEFILTFSVQILLFTLQNFNS